MQADNVTQGVVKQQNNNKTGFQLYPQNINRKGRPIKPHSLTDLTKAIMETEPDLKEKLIRKVIDMALSGDLAALKLVWSYLDGTPRELSLFEQKTPSENLIIYKPIKNQT